MTKITATIKDACEASGLGRTKIYSLINEKKLQTVKVGRRTLVKMDSLRTLLDAA